jgi:DNA topoisomerase-1
MGLRGVPRDKVLAAIVRLLEITFIRVGNSEYARDNRSYGLTTLRDKHAVIDGSEVTFKFRGKSGRDHKVDIRDRRLATIVRRCQELPGQELFQYLDDAGDVQDVDSTDVNEYLRQITGQDFTAKDFRTWAGTVLAAQALRALEGSATDTDRDLRTDVVRAVEQVAKSLGNTPAVCRACYVHPAIIDAYLDGAMVRNTRARAEQQLGARPRAGKASTRDAGRAADAGDQAPDEQEILRLLRDRLAAGQRGGRTAA